MDAEVTSTRIWMGEENQLSVGIAEDVFMSVRRGGGKDIQAVVDLPSKLKAPIHKGDEIGTVNYMDANNEVIKSAPLVALHDVEQGGFFKRIIDYIRMLFI